MGSQRSCDDTETLDELLDEPPERDEALALPRRPFSPTPRIEIEVRSPVAETVARLRPLDTLRVTVRDPPRMLRAWLRRFEARERACERTDRPDSPEENVDETLRDELRSAACTGTQRATTKPATVREARVLTG